MNTSSSPSAQRHGAFAATKTAPQPSRRARTPATLRLLAAAFGFLALLGADASVAASPAQALPCLPRWCEPDPDPKPYPTPRPTHPPVTTTTVVLAHQEVHLDRGMWHQTTTADLKEVRDLATGAHVRAYVAATTHLWSDSPFGFHARVWAWGGSWRSQDHVVGVSGNLPFSTPSVTVAWTEDLPTSEADKMTNLYLEQEFE